MSAPKHTPGPWVVQSRKRNRVCGPEGIIVAEAWNPPARAKSGAAAAARAIAEANAHLIAAAPDLLETLKAVRCHLVVISGFDTESIMITGIDEALSKAEVQP